MVRVEKAVPAPVANEITIDRLAETGFDPNHFTIAGTRNDVASEGAVDAERGTPFKIPPPPGKSRRFIRIDACRTEIDDVPGKGAFQLPILEAAEVGVICNLHGSQVAIAGKLLIETATSPAVDTTIHFVLDKDAQVLVTISPLFPEVASDSMASGYRHVLEQAMPAFVADGAIMGMVHHEPFDDVLAKIDGFFIRR
jgi:hypothetical protein